MLKTLESNTLRTLEKRAMRWSGGLICVELVLFGVGWAIHVGGVTKLKFYNGEMLFYDMVALDSTFISASLIFLLRPIEEEADSFKRPVKRYTVTGRLSKTEPSEPDTTKTSWASLVPRRVRVNPKKKKRRVRVNP